LISSTPEEVWLLDRSRGHSIEIGRLPNFRAV
jgi:hypothetical protein